MASARTKKRITRRSNSPDMPAGEQPGLRQIVQNRLLKDVFDNAAEKNESWKVLVVDEHAMRVISAAIGMYDIMERKVTVVESLELKRAPFPDMDAIYILDPTDNSIDLLLDDFQRSKPLYGSSVFLYFLGRLPDELFARIKGCKQLVKRVKTLSEINIDFLPKEQRAFSFDLRDTFSPLYLRRETRSIELSIASKLVTVCGTLNEYPHIRYKNNSPICQSLASLFKIKMDEFVNQNPSWWYHGGATRNQTATKNRGTLLLLDRADDCLSPLMHDFTYQPMVHDLLEMEGDRITYDNDKGSKTDVLLDEKDSVWVELRGKHIAAVIETLSDRIKEIMNSSTGSTLNAKQGEGNLSLSQMAAALKALPEYQEVLSKLSQHMHLSHQCMGNFTSQGLIDLAEIEQTLATGKDEDDRSPRIDDVMDKVEAQLLKMKTLTEKLRLILIAVIACGGLRGQDRRRLVAAAEFSAREMRVMDALEILGLPLVNTNDKNSPVSGLPNRLAKEDDSEYAQTRYIPLLKSVLEDQCRGELSLDDYPSLTPLPPSETKSSKASGAAASARKRDGGSRFKAAQDRRTTGPTNFVGGRTIVFLMGGACYPELRVAREVMDSESREIIVGSTGVLTAEDFMEDLSKLAEENRK